MAVAQYIGSRYVPLFADPIEWSDQNTYEPLTIVIHEGNSYTSKQAVPKGIDIANETYWALTGNYDAQVEQYRRETAAALAAAQGAQDSADAAQGDIDTLLPKADFSAENTVKKYVDEKISDAKDYATSLIKFKKIYQTIEQMQNDASLANGDIVLVSEVSGKAAPIIFIVTTEVPASFTRKNYIYYQLQNNLFAAATTYDSSKICNAASLSTVDKMTRVAKTYVEQKDAFTYGNPDPTWPMKISCSIIASMLAMGIPYYNSPYITARTTQSFAVGVGGYGIPLYDEWPTTQGDMIYTSALLAQWAALNGFGYLPKDDFSNIRPGDFIFFAPAENADTDNYFLGITHCDIMLLPHSPFGFESNRNNNSSVKYVTVNGGFSDGYPVRFHNRIYNSSNPSLVPVFCMRLPFDNGNIPNVKATLCDSVSNGAYQIIKPSSYDASYTHVVNVCGIVIPSTTNCRVTLKVGSTVYASSYFNDVNNPTIFSLCTELPINAASVTVEVTEGHIHKVGYAYDGMCCELPDGDYIYYENTETTFNDYLNKIFSLFDLWNSKDFEIRLFAGLSDAHLTNAGTYHVLVKNQPKNVSIERTSTATGNVFTDYFSYSGDTFTLIGSSSKVVA